MKQLEPYKHKLNDMQANFIVKSATEPAFKRYLEEANNMYCAQDKFIMECNVSIITAEQMTSDCDEADAEAHKSKMATQTANAEHHLGGVRAAVKRFQGMTT